MDGERLYALNLEKACVSYITLHFSCRREQLALTASAAELRENESVQPTSVTVTKEKRLQSGKTEEGKVRFVAFSKKKTKSKVDR